MPTVKTRQVGSRGLLYDQQPADLDRGDFTEMRNCRWRDGAISNLPAITEVDSFSSAPRYGAPWNIDTGDGIVIIEATTWTLLRSGFADEDVTPTSFTDSDYWYHTQIGTVLVITNGVDAPFTMAVTDIGVNPFQTMSGWPSTYRANVIDTFKGRLIATQVTKGGVFQPAMVKGSHPFSPGDTEFFWDFTDPQLLAFEDERQFGGRTLVGTALVRDFLIIAYDRGVEVASLAPRGAPGILSYRALFEDDGMVSPHAKAELPGFALIMGRHDIYMTDGVSRRSLTDGRISQWLTRTVDYTGEVYIAYWPRRNEVHISFRTSGNDDADVNLIYNTVQDIWTRQDTVDGTGAGTWVHLFRGPELGAQNPVWADYTTETWQELNSVSWSDLFSTNENTVLYGIAGTKLYDVDPIAPTGSFAQKLRLIHDTMDLDEFVPSVGDVIKYLNRIYPQVRSPTASTVNFRVGVKDNPNAGARLQNAVAFNTDDDYAVDVRCAGRYLVLQILEDADSDELFTISGYDMEIEGAGKR